MDSTDGDLLTIGDQGPEFVEIDSSLDPVAVIDALDLAPRAGADARALDSVEQAILRDEFSRPDAYISMILVSDQDDTSEQTIDAFYNRMRSLRAPRRFSVSAVVPTGDCGPSGHRLIEAANRSGGIFQSICTSDWNRPFDGSTINFGYRSQYFLSRPADRRDISLSVRGQPLDAVAANGTSQWSYNPTAVSVGFTPFAVPQPGTPFSVTYTPSCPGLPLP